MASQKQIDDTYNYWDRFIRLSLGDTAEITCAMYDGDFSKSLEQAQADKHEYILRNIGFRPGFRVLDVGCGWGPILKAVADGGGDAVGITLSTQQAESCRRQGFNVHLLNWNMLRPETFGSFDGIVSVGAFEHFCSPEEFVAGNQDAIYSDFFRICRSLLPNGGRLYLQTMLWGPTPPRYEDFSLAADKSSQGYILAVLEKFYPGSWLPLSIEQIGRCAQPYFELISCNNGRRDYIETLAQFGKRTRQFKLRKLIEVVKLLPRFCVDRNFRYQIESAFRRGGYNRYCFVHNIMDHQRMTLQTI